MRRVLCFMLIMIGCLLFTLETRAQTVYGESWLEYDEPTNSMRAIAYSYPDYSVDTYYCTDVYMAVFQDGNYLGGQGASNTNYWGWPTGCSGMAYVEQLFPYDPNSEYTLEASHSVSNIMVPQQTAYHDPYGFYTYADGEPIYYPLYFNFLGTGYPSGQTITNIMLGMTFSIFTEGATAGRPHHFVVSSDTGQSRFNSCNSISRTVRYRIVDANGRNAGAVPTREVSDPPNPVSSCDDRQVILGSCGIHNDSSTGGLIWDLATVGCAPGVTGSSTCGYDVTIRWQWCPRERTPVTLARIVWNTHANEVKANGYLEFPWKHQIFP